MIFERILCRGDWERIEDYMGWPRYRRPMCYATLAVVKGVEMPYRPGLKTIYFRRWTISLGFSCEYFFSGEPQVADALLNTAKPISEREQRAIVTALVSGLGSAK